METPPVVLVHGFLSTRSAMIPLQLQLRRLGLDVHRAELSPLCIQDVRELGEQVGRTVDRVRALRGVERVDLVGVSQGGLAAVYYLRCLGGGAHVRRLVTLGTPFLGTDFARWGTRLLGWVSEGAAQSLPGSDIVRQLAGCRYAGEQIVSIAREGDPVAPPSVCRLEGARHVLLPRGRFPLVHQSLGFSPTVTRAVVEALR